MTNEIMIYINYIVGLKVHNKILLFFESRKKIIAYIINKGKEKKNPFDYKCFPHQPARISVIV